jgi:ATP-dependent DNA helicase RecG
MDKRGRPCPHSRCASIADRSRNGNSSRRSSREFRLTEVALPVQLTWWKRVASPTAAFVWNCGPRLVCYDFNWRRLNGLAGHTLSARTCDSFGVLVSDHPLHKPIQFLKGVGPQRAELLAKLGVRTVEDLLWHLPRDILDLTSVVRPCRLETGKEQTVRGRIVDLDAKETRIGKSIVAALLECEGEYVRGIWFNQPWIFRKLQGGGWFLWSGKPKKQQGRWEFAHPRMQPIDEDDRVTSGGVLPRYPLTEGLRMEDVRRMTRAAVEEAAGEIPDPVPAALREELQLPLLRQAVRQVHVPTSRGDFEAGRGRILFDDLFEFELALAVRRRAWKRDIAAQVLPLTPKIDARIRRLFPFQFTEGQNAAIRDVAADLASGRAMHRLLQADVGAGKTVVAVYAMLMAVAGGAQAVLMAPTELLALQHWETLDGILAHSRVERLLLTGSLTPARRREAHERIANGEVQLVVGTQAVIQSDVRFANLGVAVIDEQHKFGVAQRSKFATSATPHVLVMTATPIPRSLCLTQFGDLDLSVISDQPPGRQKIVTSRISGEGSRQRAWNFVRRQLQQGRQAFIVCPRIVADDDAPGAVDVFAELSGGELRDFPIGLVHGQMDRDARATTMQRFRDGELAALVATTVIEVGVDIPNATLMVILQAERFGLSQLHQLRGRIGRGKFQGYCFLFSEAGSDDAGARLQALEATADGFEIAEQDFRLRGPGDVLGTRQHGELPLRVADLVRDAELLVRAREVAFRVVASGEFDSADFAPLKLRVLERFGKLFDLPQSG